MREAAVRSEDGGRPAAELVSWPKHPNLCAEEGCEQLRMPGTRYCEDCYSQGEWLDRLWADKQRRYAGDPAYAARQAERDERTKRFLAVFLFVLAVEGLMSIAFDFPLSWAWLLIQMGWALLVAALAVWLFECVKRNARTAR